jgi:hypothetical protein
MDLSAFNSKFRDFLIEELEGIYSSEKLESLSVVFEDLVKIPGFKFTIYQEISRWCKEDKPTYFYEVKMQGVSNELQWVVADGLAAVLYSS